MVNGRAFTCAGAVGLLACGAGIVVFAGDVEPPPGPVAATMKTLEDVEPRVAIRNDPNGTQPIVIDQAGSYYLAENIHALAFQHGIEITVTGVTLDLNGFTIQGNTEIGADDGIHLPDSGNERAIVVRNGTVRGFADDGIDAQFAPGCVFENLHLYDNLGDGVVAGVGSIVRGCVAIENGGVGITASGGSIVEQCSATGNSGSAQIAVCNGLVRGCAAGGTIALSCGSTGADNHP